MGTRFRLHGRDPALGLDCVGLVALALESGGFEGPIPSGYALRGGDPTVIVGLIEARGLAPVRTPAPGDVLLCASGPGQWHLAIASDDGIVHADAMLRRVVERPGPPPWPVIGQWRLKGGR